MTSLTAATAAGSFALALDATPLGARATASRTPETTLGSWSRPVNVARRKAMSPTLRSRQTFTPEAGRFGGGGGATGAVGTVDSFVAFPSSMSIACGLAVNAR